MSATWDPLAPHWISRPPELLLEDRPRQALRDDLRCDDLEWERGKAWAFEQAMGLAWYYADSNPAMSRMGRRTLARLQASPPPARAR